MIKRLILCLIFFLLLASHASMQPPITVQPPITTQPVILLPAADNSQNVNNAAREQMLAATDPRAIDVLKFWFEEWDQDKISGGRGRYNSKWFPHGPLGVNGSKEIDRIIRKRYLDLFNKAVHGALNWNIEENPYENLAWILLIDQFPRNMFRGTKGEYKYDKLGLKAAKINIKKGFYSYYFTGYEKLFVVYPLMHDESLESQKLSIHLLKTMNEIPGVHYQFLNALKKGFEHYQMIYMFGRFPYRNIRIGRKNTEAEDAYLAMKGTEGFVDGSKW